MRALEEQYQAALAEGPIIVSLPGEELRGFQDQDTAFLYVQMWQIANGSEGDEILCVV